MKRAQLGRGMRGRRTASRLRRVVATIALTLAALIAFVAQAQAATFTVGSTADTGGCAKPPTGTTCTLRQLVNSVPAGSTISVPAGTYTLTAGELLIDQNVTITGAGARTTTVEQNPPAGTPVARVFDIQPDPASGVAPTVTISGLEILFGKTTSGSTNGNIGGNVLNEGTLTLSEDDIVLGETTGGEGAGVANVGGTLTITHSLLEDNLSFASSGSGGISGGIANVASGATTATVTVNNSTLASNTAASGAGGIGSRCIRCTSSTVTVVDSTIFNNDGGTATTNAGGLIAGSGSSISVRNSIVASNTVGSGATASNCAGSITSLGHNIETSTDCGFKTATDLQNTDPDFLSAGLEDMGGNTDVIPLAAASPGVDAIPTGTTGCSGTDQRDISRAQGSSCDIGAYELIEPVEGAQFSEVVGSIDNTSATIDWGDGTAQSSGSVDPTTREVTGTHTYAEAGVYHGVLHWRNSDGNPSTRGFDVKVTDAALTATATPVSATQGTSFNGTVATFTDANPLSQASDFTATIGWGDGTAATAGTVATNAGGGFKVTGTHTYSKTGSFTTTITINDVGGSTASASGTATVSPPRPVVTSVSPTAGPTAGGTSVTITGTNLGSATAVKFGTTAATITTNTATQIVATNPAGAAGTVDVTVTNAGGTSAASANDQFTYAAVPTVTSVSPSAGPTGGGTSVTITGTAFTNASAVKFGTTTATSFTINSATSITATAPAESAGAVDITVTTPGGISANSANDHYTYAAAPTVTSVNPSAGPTGGGTSVTINGTSLSLASTVKFGATNATGFTINSATSITATAPAESAGAVDITVTTPGGTSATSANDQFTYAAVPTVTSVSPSAGPTGGGTSVTINGTNLSLASAVKFGAANASGFTINSATQITATAPAGSAGTVDITVATPGGTSATSINDNYRYAAVPTVTAVSPSAAPTAGGNSVTITGTNFVGASAVKFGTTNATFTIVSATQITATAPAESAGTVDITITTPGGTSATSASDHYTYAGTPTVTGLAPNAGPLGGGTTVTITGTNLSLASAVKFGATDASGVTVVSATKITATAPAAALAGTVDVTVTTPGGTSATTAADQYTYTNGPSVAAISPTSGPTAGGTSVTITGANLASAAVKFGSNTAMISSNTATQIVAVAPAGSAGAVDVTVTTAGGTSAASLADRYTYAGPPTVTGVSPTSGPTLGGTAVTITGTNLDNPSAVKFGGANAAVVTPISATQIIAVAPAGSAGAQDVRVTTPGGTSATSSADRFTFVPPPTVTGVSPSSGPAAGGTSVTITGTDFTGASAVHFGASQAASFSVINTTQITATSPAGAGTADVTVTTPSGTSATGAADQFTYDAAKIPPPPSSPVVLTGAPSVHSSSAAALEGSVNPQGLATTAHYEYGLDSQFRAAGAVYDQSTPSQSVGSDFSSHTVVVSLSGLVPNALYHVRLVATNSAGTTFGPDATFTTKEDPPPPPPKLGGSFNAEPVKGLVFVEINGKFIPITEVRQIPNGAIINALHGTVALITAAGGSSTANVSQAAKGKKPKAKVTTQKGTFGGAVFKVSQDHSGLATLSLVEGASFAGAPTYASCQTHSGKATVAALSKKTLQLLKGGGQPREVPHQRPYAAATVRGTVWSIADRCDGTLTHVTRGTVVVSDLVRHKSITVRAGHSYLALARLPKHK